MDTGCHQPMQIVPCTHIKSPDGINPRRRGVTTPCVACCNRRVASGRLSAAPLAPAQTPRGSVGATPAAGQRGVGPGPLRRSASQASVDRTRRHGATTSPRAVPPVVPTVLGRDVSAETSMLPSRGLGPRRAVVIQTRGPRQWISFSQDHFAPVAEISYFMLLAPRPHWYRARGFLFRLQTWLRSIQSKGMSATFTPMELPIGAHVLGGPSVWHEMLPRKVPSPDPRPTGTLQKRLSQKHRPGCQSCEDACTRSGRTHARISDTSSFWRTAHLAPSAVFGHLAPHPRIKPRQGFTPPTHLSLLVTIEGSRQLDTSVQVGLCLVVVRLTKGSCDASFMCTTKY